MIAVERIHEGEVISSTTVRAPSDQRAEQFTHRMYYFFEHVMKVDPVASPLKNNIIERFLGESLQRLRGLGRENRGQQFLGYVFEELVRFEIQALQNQSPEIADIESRLLTHLRSSFSSTPDAVGLYLDDEADIIISDIYEVKLSVSALKARLDQLERHCQSIVSLVTGLNTASRNNLAQSHPLGGHSLYMADDCRLHVYLARNGSSVVDVETQQWLNANSWEVHRSIFSLNEVAYLAKILFPEFVHGFTFKEFHCFQKTQTALEQGFERCMADISAILSGVINSDFTPQQLRAMAFVWLCSDRILLDEDLLNMIADILLSFEPGYMVYKKKFPQRFQKIVEDMRYLAPNMDQVTQLFQAIHAFWRDNVSRYIKGIDEQVCLKTNILPVL